MRLLELRLTTLFRRVHWTGWLTQYIRVTDVSERRRSRAIFCVGAKSSRIHLFTGRSPLV
jgi:hypothetical protein